MKVFITGAGGRMGTHIIPHAIARGHTVTGLVRSDASAKTISALGATPLRGSLSDTDLLVKAAKEHDAVIHCAMDHTAADMEAASQQEYDTMKLFGETLEGSNKALIMSSGTGFLGPGSDEKSPAIAQVGTRAQTETMTLGFKGVRGIALRLAMNTHDMHKMHGFLGMLIQASDKLGFLPYSGETRWSACPSDDAGLLYVLAMESAPAGTAVHALQEVNKVKDVCKALSKRTGKKVGEATPDQVKDLGWLSRLLFMDQDVSSTWTRETFKWNPKGQTLLDEIATAPKEYFESTTM